MTRQPYFFPALSPTLCTAQQSGRSSPSTQCSMLQWLPICEYFHILFEFCLHEHVVAKNNQATSPAKGKFNSHSTVSSVFCLFLNPFRQGSKTNAEERTIGGGKATRGLADKGILKRAAAVSTLNDKFKGLQQQQIVTMTGLQRKFQTTTTRRKCDSKIAKRIN